MSKQMEQELAKAMISCLSKCATFDPITLELTSPNGLMFRAYLINVRVDLACLYSWHSDLVDDIMDALQLKYAKGFNVPCKVIVPLLEVATTICDAVNNAANVMSTLNPQAVLQVAIQEYNTTHPASQYGTTSTTQQGKHHALEGDMADALWCSSTAHGITFKSTDTDQSAHVDASCGLSLDGYINSVSDYLFRTKQWTGQSANVVYHELRAVVGSKLTALTPTGFMLKQALVPVAAELYKTNGYIIDPAKVIATLHNLITGAVPCAVPSNGSHGHTPQAAGDAPLPAIDSATREQITELVQQALNKEACEFYQTLSHRNLQKIAKLLGVKS